MDRSAAIARRLEAFNVVFEAYEEGESREEIEARLAAEVDRRKIPGIEQGLLAELAEAVEDRTPIFFAEEDLS